MDEDLDRIDLLLRITPPPIGPPADLQRQAFQAIRNQDIPPRRRSAAPRRHRWILPAFAILAAVAAFEALALINPSDRRAATESFTLIGRHGATASIQVMPSSAHVSTVAIHLRGLPPVPPHGRYQLWFSDGSTTFQSLTFVPSRAAETLWTT